MFCFYQYSYLQFKGTPSSIEGGLGEAGGIAQSRET